MKYILSLSGGKDSLAMLLLVIEKKLPLDRVVFYDTGVEFQAIYNIIDQVKPLIEEYGAHLDILHPKRPFLLDMLAKPVASKSGEERYGFDWCGGVCRWQTGCKVSEINRYLSQFDEYTQYVGIACDEPKRIRYENHKVYPLVEYQMTESDCLAYCRSKGFHWKEGDIDLYDILDRVSCWCCANKNTKELRNMYHFLPEYWGYLKGLQSRIDRPFKSSTGKSIFDYEKQFKAEDSQMSIADLISDNGWAS